MKFLPTAFLPLLLASLCTSGTFAYVEKKCPPVQPLSSLTCQGRTASNCWSVGVRDLDCPGSALCCFDGCANTCLLEQKPAPQISLPLVVPPPPPLYSPPPKPDKCPNVYPKMHYHCIGRTEHTCWTVGTRDSDCPGHGLCCFDGCANSCLDKQEPRHDPCSPTPCGQGATCTTNKHNQPICKCLPGLVPKPDTITGCGPECLQDSDCSSDQICHSHHCQRKKDPCYPSPCGPGTTCHPNHLGTPVCECKPSLIPKPDAIVGCGPECVSDGDCKYGYECSFSKCKKKRGDPCVPSPCGPGTACTVNNKGNPVCQCLPGLVPKPDTIVGCGYECERDAECRGGYLCKEHRCTEKLDPCDPSPCGPGTKCLENERGNPVCRCLPGLIPKPDTITGCGPECTVDTDCQSSHMCKNSMCVKRPEPCEPNPCGAGASCEPVGPTGFRCVCPPGYFGDADVQCTKVANQL